MWEAGEARRFSEDEEDEEVSEAWEVKDGGSAKSEGSRPLRVLGSTPDKTSGRTSGRSCLRMSGSRRWTTAVMARVWKSVSEVLSSERGDGGDVATSVGEPASAGSTSCRLYGGGVVGGLETGRVSAWLGHVDCCWGVSPRLARLLEGPAAGAGAKTVQSARR